MVTSSKKPSQSIQVKVGVNPTGKVRKYPNLQKKKLFIPEINKTINIEVTARGMRTMNKRGVYATLLKAGLIQAK